MADLLDFGGVRVLTSNAAPGAGYVARFFDGGTTTPRTVYTDSSLGTAHGTSVTADSAGRYAAVWSSGGAVKCVIEDASGATVQTIDPVIAVSESSSAAENISFTPTVDLPFDNVQDAIEGAAESAASGFSPFGLGITGNATLLSNIDATNIGAGAYRFDNTTTGTFPTGVAAADTGLIEHWRQSSGAAMQFLFHATTDKIFHRRMASSAWGTWRENITANQGATEGDILYRGASAWTRLAKGTASQFLKMNSGATVPEWGAAPTIQWQTAISVSSGTSSNLSTTIPASVTEMHVRFKGAQLTTGDNIRLRIGPSGGLVTSGYLGGATVGGSALAFTSGFGLTLSNTLRIGSGHMRLTKTDTNIWLYSMVGFDTGGDNGMTGHGEVDAGGVVSQAQISVTGGAFTGTGTWQIGWR